MLSCLFPGLPVVAGGCVGGGGAVIATVSVLLG